MGLSESKPSILDKSAESQAGREITNSSLVNITQESIRKSHKQSGRTSKKSTGTFKQENPNDSEDFYSLTASPQAAKKTEKQRNSVVPNSDFVSVEINSSVDLRQKSNHKHTEPPVKSKKTTPATNSRKASDPQPKSKKL